ncbi:GerMN domain-containing protein [Streptomyces sp. M19]
MTLVLSGKQLATVDAKHAYEPHERAYEERIHVSKVGSEWRIDSLPQGLVLGEADFRRIYRSVNRYYFAELGPDAAGSRFGEDVLVADPVYLRGRIDLVTSTVKALLDGPTNWLDPVVSTAFPTGTALGRASQKLTLDDSNGLTVRLSDKATHVDQARCQRMAAQLLFTVRTRRRRRSTACGWSARAARSCARCRARRRARTRRSASTATRNTSTSSTSATGWSGWPTRTTGPSRCRARSARRTPSSERSRCPGTSGWPPGSPGAATPCT